MAFKALKVEKLTPDLFNRSEQNTQEAFEELSQTESVAVQEVIASATVNQYLVKSSDVFIVVDARGGAMKIVLYPPSGQSQTVSVKNNAGTNKVTIVQSNGQKMGGNLPAVIDVPANASVQMVSTGKQWVSF